VQWLYNLNIPIDEDWLILGDFNFIRSPENRNKPGGNIDDMLIFNDVSRTQNLTELSIKGRKYTWSNMQEDPLLEQLDWFFYFCALDCKLSSNHCHTSGQTYI
jgi:hypothetical protein